jgi:hypothetical protein
MEGFRRRLSHYPRRRRFTIRKVLVWTAVALFAANVFALPRTLAALGLRGGGGSGSPHCAEPQINCN